MKPNPMPLPAGERPFWKLDENAGAYLGTVQLPGTVVDLYVGRSGGEYRLTARYGLEPEETVSRAAVAVAAWTVAEAARNNMHRALALAYLRALFID